MRDDDPTPADGAPASPGGWFRYRAGSWHHEFVLTGHDRARTEGFAAVAFEPRRMPVVEVPRWLKKLESLEADERCPAVLAALEKRLLSRKSTDYYDQAARIVAAMSRDERTRAELETWLTQDLITRLTSFDESGGK